METEEPLETGYGPGTPPGDNLCNDYAQNLAVAYSSLAHARGDRVERHDELALLLVDRGSPSEFGNVVVARRPLSEGEWHRAAERLRAFYSEHDGGPLNRAGTGGPCGRKLQILFRRVRRRPQQYVRVLSSERPAAFTA